MKRFRFALDRLLALRKYREQEWERKLAAATGKVVTTQKEIDRRVLEKARALREQYRGGADIMHLLATSEYMRRLDQELEQAQLMLARYKVEWDEVQVKYLEHSRERKVLDRLKERKAQEYVRSSRVQEEKELDDISSGRAASAGA